MRGVAGAEPFAGLREAILRTWIAAICRWICWRRRAPRVADLRLPRETPALRVVFSALLDRCDELEPRGKAPLPARAPGVRLRLECAVIAALARRLTARLRNGDPLAQAGEADTERMWRAVRLDRFWLAGTGMKHRDNAAGRGPGRSC